jgi:hypothetical protein
MTKKLTTVRRDEVAQNELGIEKGNRRSLVGGCAID